MLTDKRMCLLVHYVLRPDQGFEFPRGSVMRIEPSTLLTAITFWRVTYRTERAISHIDVASATARTAATVLMGPSIDVPHMLATLRSSWHDEAPEIADLNRYDEGGG